MRAMEFRPLLILYLKIDQLKPFSRNARTHTKRQIKQIAESIRVFGFVNPILVDRNNRIIAGHGRVEAAKLLGLQEVPTILLEGLTEDQIRAYIIADNKLAENAGWDRAILAVELQHLLTLDCADFTVDITGFEVAEIDAIIEDPIRPEEEDEFLEQVPGRTPISETGDLWFLGKHRLLCGNSLHDQTFKTLMGNRRAAVVSVDPPYNVRIDGHATGKGAIHHREFAMASGEMSDAEYVSFLGTSLRLLARYSANNSLHYLFIDWRHVGDLIAVGKQNYDEFLNLCCWVKDNGGMGSFYRSRHELVLVFRKGKGPHRNNIQLGQFGRNRTNVWQYPGIHSFLKQSEEGNLLALHPTVKPVAMVADAILDCTARGEIVLDSFLGSGTTLLAAERVGRLCYGIEIDPIYVDVAIRRWQEYTGEAAIHASTGKRFDEIAAQKEADRG
jgi:ParB-like chromosome segregation protein Spo0J